MRNAKCERRGLDHPKYVTWCWRYWGAEERAAPSDTWRPTGGGQKTTKEADKREPARQKQDTSTSPRRQRGEAIRRRAKPKRGRGGPGRAGGGPARGTKKPRTNQAARQQEWQQPGPKRSKAGPAGTLRQPASPLPTGGRDGHALFSYPVSIPYVGSGCSN